eukprot:1358607-Amorphochlora_amoeboformis.AAC.1
MHDNFRTRLTESRWRSAGILLCLLTSPVGRKGHFRRVSLMASPSFSENLAGNSKFDDYDLVAGFYSELAEAISGAGGLYRVPDEAEMKSDIMMIRRIVSREIPREKLELIRENLAKNVNAGALEAGTIDVGLPGAAYYSTAAGGILKVLRELNGLRQRESKASEEVKRGGKE